MILYVALIAVVLVAIVVALVLAGGGGEEKPPDQGPAQEQTAPSEPDARADARLTKCSVDPSTRWPTAELRITNHSSKTSDYSVEVEFVGADGVRIAEGVAVTSNLAPDRAANESAVGIRQTSGKVVCRITDVTRFASP
ncbi:hypothetical protein [Streptomyces flavofungini]|uniref:hypothetical protein n=1 Tax=Streptomyces flavofungini TaxID=68200 RepID=UPI0025B046DB|nr:hypothetical protein [Streptomyces flavofungini]WJV48553.1 hypothetical protein QUY26_25365 [Streptomyces flavofungini]